MIDILSLLGSRPMLADSANLAHIVAQVGAKSHHLDNRDLKGPDEILARTTHKYDVVDGVAMFQLHGLILDRPEWFLDMIAIDYVVSSHFGEAIKAADSRDDVERIVIDCDSPGGIVFGLQGAYEAVRDAKKPVAVAVNGLMASAALYILAAADTIITDPAAIVGSIGTMTTMTDWSRMFKEAGVEVHMISTGPQKGAGHMGTEIEPHHLEAAQVRVDALCAQFIDVVAEGRGLDREYVEKIATGDVWVGAHAIPVGLIDDTSPTPLAAASITAQRIRKENNMSMSKDELRNLLAANPQHSDLICKMDADGASVADVSDAIKQADHKSAIETAQAEAKAAVERAEAAETALAESTAKHEADMAKAVAERDEFKAKFEAMEPASRQTSDPGPDGEQNSGGGGDKNTITRSQYRAATQSGDTKLLAAFGKGELTLVDDDAK